MNKCWRESFWFPMRCFWIRNYWAFGWNFFELTRNLHECNKVRRSCSFNKKRHQAADVITVSEALLSTWDRLNKLRHEFLCAAYSRRAHIDLIKERSKAFGGLSSYKLMACHNILHAPTNYSVLTNWTVGNIINGNFYAARCGIQFEDIYKKKNENTSSGNKEPSRSVLHTKLVFHCRAGVSLLVSIENTFAEMYVKNKLLFSSAPFRFFHWKIHNITSNVWQSALPSSRSQQQNIFACLLCRAWTAKKTFSCAMFALGECMKIMLYVHAYEHDTI